jgi:hypothetical protein
MAKKDDTPKNSSSVIDEIEQQLGEVIARKKEEVEKDLEEKIRREREEAHRRIEELDKEVEQEKKTLVDFKALLSEFEANKKYLKKQIKEHIETAIRHQTEIESLTGQTLEELKKVSDLNRQLEELQQDTGEKVLSLKKDLEEKYGIVAEVPEGDELGETEIDLEHELTKLKKIKDLLSASERAEEVSEEAEPREQEEGEGEEAAAEPVEEPQPQEEQAEKEEFKGEQQEGAAPSEEPEMREEEGAEEEKEEEREEEPQEAQEQAEGEAPSEEKPGAEGEEASFQVAFEKLEQYRKSGANDDEVEVSYFENDNKIILDGEYLVSTLNNCFEEAKKLYIKLSQTESPKDQFFIKQEIIKQQEHLRKVMLRGIRLCQRENCSLPEFTQEILNLDVLKEVLEKVSMQNWSNQDDFAAFDNFAKELKDSFYTRITPPAAYLQSILRELGIS